MNTAVVHAAMQLCIQQRPWKQSTNDGKHSSQKRCQIDDGWPQGKTVNFEEPFQRLEGKLHMIWYVNITNKFIHFNTKRRTASKGFFEEANPTQAGKTAGSKLLTTKVQSSDICSSAIPMPSYISTSVSESQYKPRKPMGRLPVLRTRCYEATGQTGQTS